MKTSKWTLLLTAPLIALACAQKVDVTAAPPPPERIEGTSDLQTVTTGQAVTAAQWNQQNFLARTKVDAFRAVYKFQSGSNRTFQVFNLSAPLINPKNCPAQISPPAIFLQSIYEDSPISIQQREVVALHMDEEYELTIVIPSGCDEAQSSLQFMAWMGTTSQVVPDVGRICQDAQGNLMTFFMSSLRAFSDPQHPYIDQTRYCGIDSGSPVRSCGTMSLNGVESTICQQQATESDGFAFRMGYDPALQQVRLQCSLNGSVFDQKILQSCREQILDSALYH